MLSFPNCVEYEQLRANLGLSIDINHVDKVYKSLSKPVLQKKTSKLLNMDRLFYYLKEMLFYITILTVDLQPKLLINFSHAMNPKFLEITTDNGFYIKPIKFGYAKNTPANSFVWRQRGRKKITLKKKKTIIKLENYK